MPCRYKGLDVVQAIEKVPVDSKTDMPRDEVKIVSIDIMETHDAGEVADACACSLCLKYSRRLFQG